ncbi:MAG TPA: hypothetical protein VMH92_07830 [Acidocella sp.]|nr:hypothetical protein [Acidocella sp.]
MIVDIVSPYRLFLGCPFSLDLPAKAQEMSASTRAGLHIMKTTFNWNDLCYFPAVARKARPRRLSGRVPAGLRSWHMAYNAVGPVFAALSM